MLENAANPDVYAYIHEDEGKKILVLLNFRATSSVVNPSLDTSKARLLIGNYPGGAPSLTLRPYEVWGVGDLRKAVRQLSSHVFILTVGGIWPGEK